MPVLPPALLLTAGLGTRLRPLTALCAKPALPVAGIPLVRRILAWVAGGGVTRVVLNLHHLPDTICAVVGDGSDLGLDVRYSWENPVLGSAGGPRRALPLLAADRILIVNGDTLTDLDLPALAAAHSVSGALVTMALVPNTAPHRYGGVLVEADGAVAGFVPRGHPSPSWHFIGVQVAEADAFHGISPDQPSESVSGLYPRLMRERPGSVRAFRCEASFRDIGTPRDYLDTSLDLAGDPAALLGRNCRVPQTARVSRSILWDDVEVGRDARLHECVVAAGVRIPPGMRLSGQIVVPGSVAADPTCPPGADVGDVRLIPLDHAQPRP